MCDGFVVWLAWHLLWHHGLVQIRKEAIWTLSNVAAGSQAQVIATIIEGAFETVTKLVRVRGSTLALIVAASHLCKWLANA